MKNETLIPLSSADINWLLSMIWHAYKTEYPDESSDMIPDFERSTAGAIYNKLASAANLPLFAEAPQKEVRLVWQESTEFKPIEGMLGYLAHIDNVQQKLEGYLARIDNVEQGLNAKLEKLKAIEEGLA